jgi:hypothetical protein
MGAPALFISISNIRQALHPYREAIQKSNPTVKAGAVKNCGKRGNRRKAIGEVRRG